MRRTLHKPPRAMAIALLFAALSLAIPALRAATLVWDRNTEKNLAGYFVYIEGGLETDVVDVGLKTSFSLDALPRGINYTFYVTAYNFDGIESDPSASVSYALPYLTPVFYAQPSSLIAETGSTIPLTVQANADGANYQWSLDGVPLPGATSQTLIIEHAASANSGRYSVVITTPGGVLEPQPFNVHVQQGISAPVITQQPQSRTVLQGAAAELTAGLLPGRLTARFQWWKDGQPIAGATSSALRFENAAVSDSGKYFVTIRNAAGMVVSEAATLEVLLPPSIETGPADAQLAPGERLELAVNASGTGPLQYQWFKDSAPIQDATNSIFALYPFKENDAGLYWVQISNSAGTNNSTLASVRLIPPPVITVQPLPLTVQPGQPAAFTVTAGGIGPFYFQWTKDGAPLPAATNSAFALSSAQYSDAGSYSVTVSNRTGAIVSDAVLLSVGGPQILADPSATVSAGATLWLNVPVAGDEPLTYQWFRNGALVPQMTGPTFIFSPVTFADQGTYTLKVSNPRGTATRTGQLTVLSQPPPAPAQPAAPRLSIRLAGRVVIQSSSFQEGSLAVQVRTNLTLGEWKTIATIQPAGTSPIEIDPPTAAGSNCWFLRTLLIP